MFLCEEEINTNLQRCDAIRDKDICMGAAVEIYKECLKDCMGEE
jgi:hypothetical protein